MGSNYQGQTGPKSVQGKLNIRFNALKSGIFAKSPVLPFEDEKQYRRHVKLVMRSLQPENAVQQHLAQQIADSMWKGTRHEYQAALKRDELFQSSIAHLESYCKLKTLFHLFIAQNFFDHSSKRLNLDITVALG